MNTHNNKLHSDLMTMLKKLISLILVLIPVAMSAQLAVGGWTLHTPYRNVDRMAETTVYVYYMSQGALFRIDKATTEVQSLNISTLLNDGNVNGLYADRDGKSMLVTYASGNMDRIYDSGKIVNISDIKDAVMTTSRNINHVDFGNGMFLVATDFGMVVMDDKKNEVQRTIYTPSSVKNVVASGEYVGLYMGEKLLFAKNDHNLTSVNVMKSLDGDNGGAWNNMKGAGDKWIYLINFYNNTYHLHKAIIDFENNTFVSAEVKAPGTNNNSNGFTDELSVCKNGIYACNDKGAYIINHNGEESYVENIIRKSDEKMSYFDDNKRAWKADADGVHFVDVASGHIIVDTSKPSNLTVGISSAMHVGNSGKIYVYNLGEHDLWKLPVTERSQTFVNVISKGNFIDVSGVDVKTDNRSSNSFTPTVPHHVAYGFRICEDPTDPDAYYVGTMFEGCYRIKDGKQTHKYFTDNSPLIGFAGTWAYPVGLPIVDRNGNLWLYQFREDIDGSKRIHYLPSSKRMSDDVKVSDWTSHSLKDQDKKTYRDMYGFACKQSDHVIMLPGRWNDVIIVLNGKGTESPADDTLLLIKKYIDQDSKQLSFSHGICGIEDMKGRIWIGTDKGVFEITDIKKVNSSTITVNHLKVPRNDGTNLADYLLDGQMVNCIALDGQNRKWIATMSGVYLVSENGDEILEHFTTDNSILPSNSVYSVACDANSSSVFFGTNLGVVEYNSTSSPGYDNYNDVVAYPNPVRPDYYGWITIKGLMDDSLVKITDASGNVFHQGRSNGGMYVWDGCNADGERVKTGVYYVMASQNATGSTEACVTKIMVVN